MKRLETLEQVKAFINNAKKLIDAKHVHIARRGIICECLNETDLVLYVGSGNTMVRTSVDCGLLSLAMREIFDFDIDVAYDDEIKNFTHPVDKGCQYVLWTSEKAMKENSISEDYFHITQHTEVKFFDESLEKSNPHDEFRGMINPQILYNAYKFAEKVEGKRNVNSFTTRPSFWQKDLRKPVFYDRPFFDVMIMPMIPKNH